MLLLDVLQHKLIQGSFNIFLVRIIYYISVSVHSRPVTVSQSRPSVIFHMACITGSVLSPTLYNVFTVKTGVSFRHLLRHRNSASKSVISTLKSVYLRVKKTLLSVKTTLLSVKTTLSLSYRV
jgi:hypothetical protein